MESAPFRSDEFTNLLRETLLGKKQISVKQLAAAIRLTPRTFYARLHNGSRFSPDEVKGILREVPDECLAKWLFARSRLVLVRRPSLTHDLTSGTILQGLQTCTELQITALIDVVDGLSKVSFGLGQMITARVRHAQSELIKIKYMLGSGPPLPDANPVAPVDFSSIVRKLLVVKREIPLADIASSLGLTYHNLYTRITGRVTFDPNDLRNLLQHYPEPEIAAYLLAGTPYTAELLPQPKHAEVSITPVRAGILALREVLTVLSDLDSPSTPDAASDRTLNDHLDAAVEHLELVRWSTIYIGARQPADAPRPIPVARDPGYAPGAQRL